MNPTLNQNQLDFLAEKVMGLKHLENMSKFWEYENGFILTTKDWQPHINKSQAMDVLEMVLNTHEEISLFKMASEPVYSITAVGDGCCTLDQGQKINELGTSFSLTICLFALKLYGYKEGGDAA